MESFEKLDRNPSEIPVSTILVHESSSESSGYDLQNCDVFIKSNVDIFDNFVNEKLPDSAPDSDSLGYSAKLTRTHGNITTLPPTVSQLIDSIIPDHDANSDELFDSAISLCEEVDPSSSKADDETTRFAGKELVKRKVSTRMPSQPKRRRTQVSSHQWSPGSREERAEQNSSSSVSSREKLLRRFPENFLPDLFDSPNVEAGLESHEPVTDVYAAALEGLEDFEHRPLDNPEVYDFELPDSRNTSHRS